MMFNAPLHDADPDHLVTDVDDKIILAARQQHLFQKFMDEHTQIDSTVKSETQAAFGAYLKKNLATLQEYAENPAGFPQAVEKTYGHVLQGKSLANDGSTPGVDEAKIKMHVKTLSTAADALTTPGDATDFYSKTSGILMSHLDAKYGTTVDANDHELFNKLAKK